jgi:3-keto-5-aminohexanoate cleavage enzyme
MTVITCAVSGAETTREQNPNLPLTSGEIAGAARDACRAGAAILHLHVRDDGGNPTQDADTFRTAIELVREACDIVIEVTTGGAVGMSLEERMQPLALGPEMASLDCGNVNFGDDYIVNTVPMMRECAAAMKERGVRPTLECFDLSHVDAAAVLVEEGLVEPPLHYGLVLGVPGGVRYDMDTLEFLARRLPVGARWTAVGVGGKAAAGSILGALELGGFVRVGFEDNVYLEKGVLADSNAQLVERAAHFARARGLEVATPSDVRRILELGS